MDLDRREFLRRAGMVGGAAFAAGGLASCGWFIDWPGTGPLGSILDLPATSSPIDHIVVVTMENRSFDHYMGWLAGDVQYLTRRDRTALNIGASLAAESVDADVGFDLDQVIAPISAPCGGPEGLGFRAQPNPAEGLDAFDELAWARYLERVGSRVAPFS